MPPKKGKSKEKKKYLKINNDDESVSGDDETDVHNSDIHILAVLERLFEQQERNFKLFETTIVNSLKESFNVQLSSMANDIFNLNTKVDSLMNENQELKEKLSESDGKIVNLEKELSKAYNDNDELESYVRRQCLVVNNLKPQTGKSDQELFLDLCATNFSDLNISSETISKIHRLPRNPNNQNHTGEKPLALVVKFVKDMDRDKLFKNKKNLKGKGITITELLTSKRSQLLSKCIEKIPTVPLPRAIWTDNGKILVKLGENRPVQLKNHDDLEKLIKEMPHYVASSRNNAA